MLCKRILSFHVQHNSDSSANCSENDTITYLKVAVLKWSVKKNKKSSMNFSKLAHFVSYSLQCKYSIPDLFKTDK